MLNYIDNYKYSQAQRQDIDSQLNELKQTIKAGADSYQIYQRIRQYIFREIKIEELAVTKILNDLIEIKNKSDKAFIVLLELVANPLMSYKEIGQNIGVSKQRIHQYISEYSQHYVWLDNLRKIKGEEDAKNENNRSIRFNQKGKKNDGQSDGIKKFQPFLF